VTDTGAVELLAVPGSLRRVSSNRTLLEAAAALAPPGVAVRLSDHLAALPHFNPDLDGGTPPAPVGEWRRAVAGADGLLLSVPEYAHGLPGAFKNGLDWLVPDPAVLHKPVGIWNASARGEHAQASLREVLRTMSTTIVEEAGLTLPLLDGPVTLAGLLGTPALRLLLSDALAAFVRRIRQGRAA